MCNILNVMCNTQYYLILSIFVYFILIILFISLLLCSIAMQPGTIISFGKNNVLSYLILILQLGLHIFIFIKYLQL